ncbi:winged helix-turn-helix domain-containing protein [Sulfitobacter sp. HGT1]|uniref:winged helix-turn-helix domain-containing protein n=1 Tax=Sulfitobacter sp. HGT1 TaxID=2735435 RepID=UPI001594B46A|nr:winged helix-turn-helix domain-containing protein [Sulfitobacter sp. HGT1]
MDGHAKIPLLLISADDAVRATVTRMVETVLCCDLDVVDTIEDIQSQPRKTSLHDLILVQLPEVPDATFEAIKEISTMPDGPMVMVLNNTGSETGVLSFLAGAVDVFDWPISINELALRILLRLGKSLDLAHLYRSERLGEIEAIVASNADLTVKESQILHVLFMHTGEIVSRDALSLEVDSRLWRYGDRKFDVHVAKIRKKLVGMFDGAIDLSTIRSSGYQLTVKRDLGELLQIARLSV